MCGSIEIGNHEFYVLKKEDLQHIKKIREEKLKECVFHAHNPAMPHDLQLEFKEKAERYKKEIQGIEHLLTLPIDIVILIEITLLLPMAE